MWRMIYQQDGSFNSRRRQPITILTFTEEYTNNLNKIIMWYKILAKRQDFMTNV